MHLLRPGSRLRQTSLTSRAMGGVSAIAAPVGSTFATVAHPTLCRSDAANTVPCGDGDAIRWWRDLVTGTWYEQATSGRRFILRADGSRWYAEGDGTRSHNFGPQAVGGVWTVGSAAYTLTNATQMVLSSDSGLVNIELRWNTGGPLPTLAYDSSGITSATAASGWRRLIGRRDSGGSSRLLVDGTQVGTATIPARNPAIDFWLGSRGGSAFFLTGRVAAVCIGDVDTAVADSWLARYTP